MCGINIFEFKKIKIEKGYGAVVKIWQNLGREDDSAGG